MEPPVRAFTELQRLGVDAKILGLAYHNTAGNSIVSFVSVAIEHET